MRGKMTIPPEVLRPQFQPTWADLQRLALYEPTIYALITLVRQNQLSRENALLVAVFKLVDLNQMWMAAEYQRCSANIEPRATCRTCRSWNKLASDGWGECGRLVDSSGLTHGSRAHALDERGLFARLRTAPDFGCVQWEAK